MKKKLSLMLCLCFMVLAMTACGTDPKSVDYFGMSYSDIQDNMEQTVSALVSFSDEDIQSGAEYYDSNGMDAFAHLLTSWGETVSDLGSYQGLGDLTVTKAQKTVTADQVLHFSDRDVVVSYYMNTITRQKHRNLQMQVQILCIHLARKWEKPV